MQDRVPTKPNRVRIQPEDGSPAFYATMTRADEPTQNGTPLNKNTFLKDTTAALFGLDNQAVPDDVFAKLKNHGLTAVDVGAVPLDGSANMTGNLHTEQQITAGIESQDAGGMFVAWKDWNKRRFIWVPTDISPAGFNTLQYVDVEANTRSDIFHSGNKPTGTYTGNGSEATRTIETGGSGNCCLIYRPNTHAAVVTPSGAIVLNTIAYEETLSALMDAKIKFIDGIITIATTDISVNSNNTTYYYQVL